MRPHHLSLTHRSHTTFPRWRQHSQSQQSYVNFQGKPQCKHNGSTTTQRSFLAGTTSKISKAPGVDSAQGSGTVALCPGLFWVPLGGFLFSALPTAIYNNLTVATDRHTHSHKGATRRSVDSAVVFVQTVAAAAAAAASKITPLSNVLRGAFLCSLEESYLVSRMLVSQIDKFLCTFGR